MFRQLRAHMARRWPGTLVLAACQRAPRDPRPESGLDWIRLPPGDSLELDRELVGFMGGMFDCRAALFVGAQALAMVGAAGLGPRIAVLPRRPADEQGVDHVVVAKGKEWLAQIDQLLVRTVPVELFCRPDHSPQDVLQMLAAHPLGMRAHELVLNWQGVADERLGEILHLLRQRTRARVLVDLFLSELFDVPRAWLVPSVGDVFLHPRAWRQLAGFGGLLFRAPGNTRFQLSSDSPRAWVRAGVAAFNSSLALLGRGRP